MVARDGIVFIQAFDRFQFTGTANIAEVQLMDLSEDETGQKHVCKISVEDVRHLVEPLDVDVMWYSLTIVRNLVKPWLHFRRGYRLLPAVDFETIVKGQPFVARSGYYELLNALPPSLKAAYQAEEILSANGGRLHSSFRRSLERLHAYVDERVVAVGRLLASIGELAAALQLGDGAVEHTFVSSPDEGGRLAGRADELGAQLRRFAKLQQALGIDPLGRDGIEQPDAVVKAVHELDAPELQRAELRFERIFAAAI
jgi:hypothetical protein